MRTVLLTLILFVILFTVSSAQANVRLTNNSAASEHPVVAIDSVGTNVVVWQDNRDGNYEIYWRRFTELGVPLTGEVRVTNTTGKSVRPDVSCDSTGKNYIVWQEGENVNGVGTVYFCVLDRHGSKVLAQDVQLGSLSGYARIYTQRSGISSVVWFKSAPTDQDVYFRRLSATGATLCEQRFNKGTLVSLNKTPCVAVANGTAALYWRDLEPFSNYMLYEAAVYANCTKSPAGVMYPNSNALNPDVDALETSGSVWVVFDLSGKIYEFLGGQNACVISSPSGSATLPRIAYDGHKSFVVWQDSRDGNSELYMCQFVEDCESEINDVRLTSDPASSQRPDIAVPKDSQGRWVAVWQEARDGNSEIYMTGFAISEHGQLVGRVTEVGGTPALAGATVTLLQGDLVIESTTTGPDGRYITDLLPLGTYTVRVTRDCYRTYEESGISIPKGLPTVKNVELERGPFVAKIFPEKLVAGDTGVDVLIKGEGLLGVDTVDFGTDSIVVNFVAVWGDTELHVNVDLDTALSLDTVRVQAENTCGFLSTEYPLPIHSFPPNIRHPRDYAPTFWFAPVEEWFPTSPFFRDPAGETYWDSAPSRKQAYSALMPSQRKDRAIVYYHVYGDDTDEPGVPFLNENGPLCIVYEYWLYFIYDDFVECETIIWNQHYHDWEKFFVFVGKDDGEVKGMAGNAHLDFNVNNVYEFENGPQGAYHPLVMVESGGHATCPDMDGDGEFNWAVDVNGCTAPLAWGIQDLVTNRDGEGKCYGPDASEPRKYRLVSLSSLRQVVDPFFTVDMELWDDSRENNCTNCNNLSKAIFWGIREAGYSYSTTTFKGSPVAPYDPSSQMIWVFQRVCGSDCWYQGEHPFVLAHMPIEHAWRGSQGEYLLNPRKILEKAPRECYGSVAKTFLRGFVQLYPDPPSYCDFAIIVKHRSTLEGIAGSSDQADASFPFGYVRPGADGKLMFANMDEGVYTFHFDSETMAPYWQTLHVSPEDTLLGADGLICLVPDTSYFTLKVEAATSFGVPLPMADVGFFVEPDSLLLPTLADSMGLAYASLDTAGTYKVTISYYDYQDSTLGIRGSFGDTVCVSFVALDVDEKPAPQSPLRTQLYQNYPNPFNPVTIIMFDISRPSHVHLNLLDVGGHMVATVFDGELGSGTHRIQWNGKTSAGAEATSGVYFMRLEVGDVVASRKLVLLK
jgi:hypothetical protein